MAVQTPKQGPDYRLELSKLVNGYLAVLEWSPARLAKMSGQSKATISRITSYDTERNPYYRPELRTIQAIAQALELTLEQRRELFYTAFPENRKTDSVLGYRYTVAMPEKGLDKINVRIDGDKRMDAPDGYAEVRFDGLEVFIYWSQGQPQVGARATGIHLVNPKT